MMVDCKPNCSVTGTPMKSISPVVVSGSRPVNQTDVYSPDRIMSIRLLICSRILGSASAYSAGRTVLRNSPLSPSTTKIHDSKKLCAEVISSLK